MDSKESITYQDLSGLLLEMKQEGGFFDLFLMDDQGFLLGSVNTDQEITENQAAALSWGRRMADQAFEKMNFSSAVEFSAVLDDGKKLIALPFEANSSHFQLVAVLPNAGYTYKRRMKTIIRKINSIWNI